MNTSNSNFLNLNCIPLSKLGANDIAYVLTVVTVVSLALGFLLFIFYLTYREGRITKYNIRRRSEEQRESFSRFRRCSQIVDMPSSAGERRPTMGDLYETILPQYGETLNHQENSALESDSSSQETIAAARWGSFSHLGAGNTWQGESDYPDDTEDTQDFLKIILGFENDNVSTRLEDGVPAVKGFNSLRRSTATSTSVRDKMKKSLNHIRHSLHSTTSMVEGESKPSFVSFKNENENSENTTTEHITISQPEEKPQYLHSVRSLSEIIHRNSQRKNDSFRVQLRNGSIPAQMGNFEKKISGGILRRNSSRHQAEIEHHRMRQRRVGVSFNSQQFVTKDMPGTPHFFPKKIDISGDTEI